MGKSSKKLPDSISFHDKTLCNHQEIAESFNEYFCNIASKLSSNIQQPDVPFTSYLPEPVPFSFFLRPTTLSEVKNIVKNLKQTASGFDDINMKIIKECSNEISPFLVYIINSSFSEGCFPKHLQIARVVPIFKGGDKVIHTNFRPISILPSFSKIFEKIVANRLMDYLTKFSLLSPNQYGFRPNYSTELALHHLCSNIHRSWTIRNFKYQFSAICQRHLIQYLTPFF